jgi:uncharacterized protein YraI
VVTTLPAGEIVTLTGGESDGWLSVSATGGDGWVYGAFLGTGESSDETPAPDTDDGGVRYTIDTVHLRSGPGTGYASLASLPVGVTLQFTGTVQDGFAEVSSDYGSGWVFAQYIDATAPEGVETPPETPDDGIEGETGPRYTIDTVHLRSGASTNTDSLAYLEVGVELQLLGEVENGFARVSSPFGEGWVYAEYIGAEQPAVPETPTEPETPSEPETPEPVARYTSAAVNLRDGATMGSAVLSVVPLGTEVSFLGQTENGFARVANDGVQGWLAAEYLSDTPPEVPDPGPAPSASLVTWPVSGGEWTISQGYNGSSHQNRSSSWQYYYSFDLKRADGSTTGQPVYSAVNGTIRWIDEATGGMSIYLGDGLAYAFFHARLDPGLQEGDTVTQGQYLGTIAPAGEAGNGGSPHLHITMWETSDEGNWSRNAIPFTGRAAIAGIEFPATGTGNDYRGYAFNP